MKSISDILRSPRFQREVSQVLIFFAILSGVLGVLLVVGASSDPEVLAAAVGGFLQAIIYAALAMFIRRGSIKALWIAGILFTLDTLLVLAQPSGTALAGAIVSRGLLICALIRYVRRERVSG